MEPIGALFDGEPADVHAAANSAEAGMVVVPISGVGALELSLAGTRRLMFQLAGAHVAALALQNEADEQAAAYAHA